MPPRYRITLQSALPDANLKEATDILRALTQAPEKQVENWLRNLPHTITGTASETKGRNLIDTFSSLGYQVGCFPPMPSYAPPVRDGIRSQLKVEFNLSATPKLPQRTSFYLTLSIITVIILTFGLSLFAALKLIQNKSHPENKDIPALLSGGQYQTAKDLLSREIAQTGGTAQDFLNRGIARMTRIRSLGRENNWKHHLTSEYWNDDLKTLRNYYISLEGDSALQDFQAAADLDPNPSEALKWLGILYRLRGEKEKARDSFQSALSREPNNVILHNFLALALIDLADFNLAEQQLKAALRLKPQDPRTLKNLGTFELYNRKDTLLALRYYQKYMGLKITSDFERPAIRNEITQIIWNRQLKYPLKPKVMGGANFSVFESERKKLARALKTKPSLEIHNALGNLFESQGMYREAMAEWQKSLNLDPKQPGLAQKLAQVQGTLGLFSRARGTLERTVKAGVESPEILYALGVLNKYFTENKQAASEYFEKYIHSQGPRLAEAILEWEELKGK